MEHASALELAAAIRSKDLSPTEAMEESIAAIDRYDRALNAIIWRDDDDARARAKAATDRISADGTDDLPPFFGVPIPIKDLYDVEGWPNTYGSNGASSDPVEQTAPPPPAHRTHCNSSAERAASQWTQPAVPALQQQPRPGC